MSKKEFVFTAVAQDRPGLVNIIADLVARYSGNWIDSSMARLGGEFAGIVRVSVPDDQTLALQDALLQLDKEGIDITVRVSDPMPSIHGIHAELELTGTDQPGILQDVSSVLAQYEVNIDELHTEVFKGSMSGEALFLVKADMILPEKLSLSVLSEALEMIAGDLMVDIRLSDRA